MLENTEERKKLLKAGLTIKTIEKLYIENNNFKIVRGAATIELIELDIPKDKKFCVNREISEMPVFT